MKIRLLFFTIFLIFGKVSAQQVIAHLYSGDSIESKILGMSNTHLFLDGGNIDWHDIKKLTFADREEKYENVYQRIEGKGIRLWFGAVLKKSNKKKGQNYSGNFWFLDGEFYYEKKKIYYVDGMNSDNIRSKIEKKFNSLTFNSKNYVIDYKALGLGTLSITPFISSTNHFFDVLCQVKEGRYRVLVTNFRHIFRMQFQLWGVSTSANEMQVIENFLVDKKGNPKNSIDGKKSMRIFSNSLDQYFDISAFSKLAADDDW